LKPGFLLRRIIDHDRDIAIRRSVSAGMLAAKSGRNESRGFRSVGGGILPRASPLQESRNVNFCNARGKAITGPGWVALVAVRAARNGGRQVWLRPLTGRAAR
jgi:hypothetical protein